MQRVIYQLHIWLGLIVAVPVLAWALSGLLYALPNTVEGGTVEKIDASRILINPDAALEKANELAGRQLPVTALTLLMKNGRPQYQAIGGLGADSIFVDAETGEARLADPPSARTRFFREAHFYFFAGRWQILLLVLFSALAALSALSGIYLNCIYWGRRLFKTRMHAEVRQG